MEATYSDTYQSEWKIMLRNLSKNEKKKKKHDAWKNGLREDH